MFLQQPTPETNSNFGNRRKENYNFLMAIVETNSFYLVAWVCCHANQVKQGTGSTLTTITTIFYIKIKNNKYRRI